MPEATRMPVGEAHRERNHQTMMKGFKPKVLLVVDYHTKESSLWHGHNVKTTGYCKETFRHEFNPLPNFLTTQYITMHETLECIKIAHIYQEAH